MLKNELSVGAFGLILNATRPVAKISSKNIILTRNRFYYKKLLGRLEKKLNSRYEGFSLYYSPYLYLAANQNCINEQENSITDIKNNKITNLSYLNNQFQSKGLTDLLSKKEHNYLFDNEDTVFVHRLHLEETIQECTLEEEADEWASEEESDEWALSQVSECESIVVDQAGILSNEFSAVIKYCNKILDIDTETLQKEFC